MARALELAREAEKNGDVPVGALVVNLDGKVIAEGFNEKEARQIPSAHAEILALDRAAALEKTWRLEGCTLVVTLEPCVMCAAAASASRVDRVVFGASDDLRGGLGSLYSIHSESKLNHRIEVVSGVEAEACREILVGFFKKKRENL